MAKITVWNGGKQDCNEVRISLEDVPINTLSQFRKKLPRLERELRKKWPVLSVDIGYDYPRRTNPHIPGELATPAALLLVIIYRAADKFLQSTADTAGKELGPDIGKQLKKAVRFLLQQIIKPQTSRRLNSRHKRHQR